MTSYNKKMWSIGTAIFGLLLCLIGIIQYWHKGFFPQILWYWFFGLGLMLASGFSFKHKVLKKLNRRDVIVIGLIVAIFTPLYLYGVHDIPRQMNTDEIAIMNTSIDRANQPNVDLFGPSPYFGFPNLIFWVMGKLVLTLGGMNLEHMRLLHATSGILIIVMSYYLFREFLGAAEAFLATSVVGLNHSLFFISRMAMRDNTALLLEVVALFGLVHGWRIRNYGWTLLGGITAGLAFYTYHPGRITIVIWISFVITYLTLRRFKDWQKILRLTSWALIGFVIVVTPLFIANSRSQIRNDYTKQQILLTEEGRELEKKWISAPDEASAVHSNITHGLLAFNRPYSDQGSIYFHPGYGFLDSTTGILIWVGVVTVAAESFRKRRIKTADMIMVTGFLLIWLSLAFVFIKAPDYTRLLIILPFIGYLVARAAGGIFLVVQSLTKKHSLRISKSQITVALVVLIALANALIIKDFLNKGRTYGNALGDTVRFQERHSQEKIAWFFMPSSRTSYFYWGSNDDWLGWLSFAKGPHQPVIIRSPDQANNLNLLQPPAGYDGYLLTNNSVWADLQSSFSNSYKLINKTSLTPDGALIAVKFGVK